MRIRMFFTVVLSLCVADFGAFAASNVRGARGTGSNAGAAQTMTTAAQATSTATTAGVVSARAGAAAVSIPGDKQVYFQHVH